ncbi:MAG TPA: transcription elongation factor GreA [Candidatus Limnocylindrales bacterium]|jgi:transcription elongation factor GreA
MATASTERGAAALIRSTGLMADGPVPWGRPVNARGPGIYVVELPDPPATGPIDVARTGRWLERTPGLLLDGERPTTKALIARLATFWLPGQSVIYAGSTKTSIGGRIASLVAHEPGDRRPHADGQWLHLLRGLERARVWWASTAAPDEYLDALLTAFGEALPFAVTRTPAGDRKTHGIYGAVAPEPAASAPVPTHVVDVPAGDADGARVEPKGTGSVRRGPSRPPTNPRTPRNPAMSRPIGSRRAAAPNPRSRSEPAYISAEGLDRLEAELEELRTVRRPAVVNRIRLAKELGDLKENSDYHAAREEQSFLEGRVQAIESLVRDAIVITGDQSGAGTIVRGSTVKLEHEGEVVTYTIVGSSEADPAAGRISAESPVGAALLGRAVGDEVPVRTPKGPVHYRVVEID